MFEIWHWLEMGQSSLFTQLQFIACVSFPFLLHYHVYSYSAVTYFHVIFVEYFMIFMVVWKMFLN